MKKVLLTTSALTLLAGAASAGISLSGYGRIGITSTAGVTKTYNRVRINATASTQTDGGLSFGIWERMQATNTSKAAATAMGLTQPAVWVSNGTVKLTIGNTVGAVANTANVWGCGAGFTGGCSDMPLQSPWNSWQSNSSTGANAHVIRVDFSLGSANISVSSGRNAAGTASLNTEVAANFKIGAASVGIGYDNGNVAATATTGASATAALAAAALLNPLASSTFTLAGTATPATGGTYLNVAMDAGSAKVGVRAVRTSAGLNGYVAHVTYGIGSGKLYAFGGRVVTAPTKLGRPKVASSYGVTYKQSLGGGAVAMVGVQSLAGVSRATAGVQFTF